MIGGQNSKTVTASEKVKAITAKATKPHAIREDVILPADKAMVSVMLAKEPVKQLRLIPWSNNTV